MSKYVVPNLSSGIDEGIVSIATTVPVFIPMFLIFVFGVVFLGGAIAQKKRTGSMDLPMWATMASLSTLMISLFLTLREGLIHIEVLSIVVTITILSGFWLFMSKNKNEV